MRIVKSTAVILSAAVLCSCAAYKDYTKVEMPFTGDLYESSQADLGSLGWRDLFTDECLQSLIEEGLENNTDLRQAALRVDEAQAAMDMARQAFLPGLNIPLAGTFSQSQERYGGSVQSFSIPASASWEVDFSGKLLASKRKAAAELERSELLRASVQTELIASIAECYYSLLKLDAQLQVSETTAASWRENVRIMKALKEAGMTNEASVSQTEANSCSVEASLYDLRYSIIQTENALSVLLGVPARHFRRASFKDTVFPETIGAGVPATLLSRRPDVMACEKAMQEAFYDTQIARAAFYPSVTLTGEAGWEKAFTTPAGWLFSAGASALQPIFAKGKLRGNLAIAQAREEESIEQMKAVLLKAGKEVNDALALCESASGKTDVRNRQIESLKSAVESTEQLMRHSGATYLEVLTAQQSLLSARLQQISDHYDAARGTVALYRALGGGAE